jgi:hypothetical protein
MKKIMFILFAFALLFSCQKEEIAPEKQLLTVEVYVNEINFQLTDFLFIVDNENVVFRDLKSVSYDSNGANIFRYQVFVENNKPVNLGIVTSYDKPLLIIGYTKEEKKYCKVSSNQSFSIKVVDNDFKNVVIE